MKVYTKIIGVLLVLLILFNLVSASNDTGNNISLNGSAIGVGVNVSINMNDSENETGLDVNPNSRVMINNFMPKNFKLGDVQFNIQVINNQNNTLNNVFAFVSGKGYSTYDVFPIQSLGPGEKDYIFVNGNFKEAGNITLTINIGSDIFYQNVSVSSDQKADDAATAEQQRKEILFNLSNDLKDLDEKYNVLADELSNKTNDNYDTSSVNLADLKKYLMTAESDILIENIGDANVNVNLAKQEYTDQKSSLDRAKTIPLIQRTKDYAVLFSAIAGALIMFFTLSELLRRKGESVASLVKFKAKKKKRSR